MLRRVVSVAATVVVVLLAAVGISGRFLFTEAPDDELQHADAVVVLGGEHDGREAYGITIARQVGAQAVLLSNPYADDDPVMRPLCNARIEGVDVICQRPDPESTRGEALMAREQARENGWQRIVVVTWRFHLPRARAIFSQCYSDDPDRVMLTGVPAAYDWPFAIWEFIYLYQYLGLAKAQLEGMCD